MEREGSEKMERNEERRDKVGYESRIKFAEG